MSEKKAEKESAGEKEKRPLFPYPLPKEKRMRRTHRVCH